MEKSNQRSLTTLAVIGMIGILGGVLFAYWDKLIPGVPAESTTATALHVGGTDKRLNVELTNTAWHALDKKEYDKAIEQARHCIEEFEVDAEEIQLSLEEAKPPTPPRYKEIFSRGPLNDVAASYFIIGKASEALGDIETAMDAYRQASKYTYALVWDERGWFWSPAKEVIGGRRAPNIEEIFDPFF